MNDLSAGEQKIVHYLLDAHGQERRLEAVLAEHATATTRTSFRQRLERHRKETREHAAGLERRIKELGGSVESVGDRAPEVVSGAAQSVARRVGALAQGGVRAIRGTGDAEAELSRAKAGYAEEAREVATYHAIEALAEALGDRETAVLAKRIRREEERMATYLEKLIPDLVRSAVREEIAPPRSSRSGTAGARRPAKRATAKAATPKRTTGKGGSTKRATTKRATTKRPTTKRAGTAGAARSSR